MEDSDPQKLKDHCPTESHHPIAQIIYPALGRISIFGSVGVRLISDRGAKAGVEENQALRLSKRALRGVALGLMSVLLVVAIPNLLQASRPTKHDRAASDTVDAVRQAMVYASDNGLYPTSIKALVEGEVVYCACTDKDPWGNDYVLSPVLIEGRTPRRGDNVYVYSRGPKGTGVYPQPFTSDTGLYGSIGYSSVHGPWGPPRYEFSQERYMLITILIFVIGVCILTKLIAFLIDLLIGAWGRSWIVLAAICNAALLAIFAATGGRSMELFLGLVVGVVFWFFLFLLAPRRKKQIVKISSPVDDSIEPIPWD
jgi:type II secretory pathway pseudopilin PulG